MNTTDRTIMNHRTNTSTAATGRQHSTATAGRRFLAFAALMLVAAFGLAGRAQAQSIGLQPNFNDETVAVTVTGEGASGITTIYWITDASETTPSFTPPSTDSETGEAISSDWNEAALTAGSVSIPVDTVAGGRYLHVRIYLAESDDVDAHYQVLRYAVPMASRVASRFRFTVKLAATDSATNDADGIKWSKASSTDDPAALTLTDSSFTYGNGVDGTATGQDTNFEYYTTYSFRAYRASQPERFPSEALTVSTDRYHLPTVVGFSPYSTATALAENASGRFSSNSPWVYVNNTHVDANSNLVTPLPGNAATYTDSLVLNRDDNSHPHQSARFEYDQPRMLVVAAAPAYTHADSLITTAFPSAPVTVDTTYSDRVVFHYRDAQDHLHYLSLSANDAVRDHDTLDYTCLWQRDAYSNTLYHTGSDGRARYLQMGSNGNMTVTTGSGTSFAIDGTVIMNAVNRSQVMVYSSDWRWSSAANAASDANAQVHYIVSCRQSRSGYFNEVTSCKVNTLAVSTGNGANDYFPLWLALDEAVLDSFNLAATPHIIVTKYRLPSHEHYFIHCANNATHDFTYYNGHSYVNHRLLPGTRSTTIINSNTDIPIGSVSYEWSVLQDTDTLFTIRQNGSANATVKRNINTFSRLTASEEYQLQVKAIYTIPGTQNNGETITATSEFKSLPLFAERNATALIPEPNSLTPNDDDIFHDGHYYLLRNYRTLADSTKAYLSGEMHAAGNNFARITTQEEAERVFIVRSHTIGDSTFYSFENPALDVEDNTADHFYLKWTGIDLYCRIHPNAIFASGTPGHLSDSMLFFLTPYKDDQGHTYFTMRPRGASPHQSLMPNNADIATGGFLTLMSSHKSQYTYSDDENHEHRHTAQMPEEAFYASRWELVDPKLLPPQITMDGTGIVTLTDYVGELRGVGGHLYWQTIIDGGTNWSAADSSDLASSHQVIFSNPLAEGTMVRAWKNAYSDAEHRYFDNSRVEEFTVTKVVAPQVAIANNQVTVTAHDGETIHWLTGDLTNATEDSWIHEAGPVASFSLGTAGILHVYASAPNKLNSDMVDTNFVPRLTLVKDEDNSSAPNHANNTPGVLKFLVVIDRGNGHRDTVNSENWTVKYTIDNNDPEGTYAYTYTETGPNGQPITHNAGSPVEPKVYNHDTGIEYSDFVNVKAYAYPATAGDYLQSELYEELLDGRYYTFCYLTPDPDRERHEQTNNFLLIDLANADALFNSNNLADYHYNRSDPNLTLQERAAQRIPETYRWMGSVVANTPSYIRNAETGAYLTYDVANGLRVTSEPMTQWTWTGEWNGDDTIAVARREACTTCYMLMTTIGTTNYYLVFDTVNNRWTAESTTNPDTRRQVAFRTTTVDYCKECPNEEGHDFLPDGNRLFLQMQDAADFQQVGAEGKQVWAAMQENQSMRFKVLFHGQDITYKANQDINIIRPEYSTGRLDEHDNIIEDDPDFFSPWQQWHRYKVLNNNVPTGDTAFTQYYTGVDGYKTVTNEQHQRDSLTDITWKYNGDTLTTGIDQRLGNNGLFTYTLDANTPDHITIKRTGTSPAGGEPNFNTLLEVDIRYNNPYTSGDRYTCNGSIFLYAEHHASTDFVGRGKRLRFASKAARYSGEPDHFLSLLPDSLVTGEPAEYNYLNNQPAVGTTTDYTQYATWMVEAVGTTGTAPYTFTPIRWQDRQLCHHPDNDYSHNSVVDNSLFLYQRTSAEAVDYAYSHPTNPNPFVGDNLDFLHFDIESFGPDNDRYIVISPYRNNYSTGVRENVADHLGLANADNDHKWINAYYGMVDLTRAIFPENASHNDSVNAINDACKRDFWHTRWKEEHAWLTPPDVFMDPDGRVTIRHRLEDALAEGRIPEDTLSNLHYYYTIDSTGNNDTMPSFVGTTGDSNVNWTPAANFAPRNGYTIKYNYANPPVLDSGQTINVVAVLTDTLHTELFDYHAHISRPHSFKALKCEPPTLVNGVIRSAAGDSIVAVVVADTGTTADPAWNSTAAGYIKDTAITLATLAYRDGDQLKARAYIPNKLQSRLFEQYQNRGLVVEVIGSPTVTTNSATVYLHVATDYLANPNADTGHYRIYWDTTGNDPTNSSNVALVMDSPHGDTTITITVSTLTEPKTFKVVALPYGNNQYTASEVVTRVLIPSNWTGSLDGAGIAENPYIISKPQDLWTMAKQVNAGTNKDKCFRVTADIDMTGIELESIGTGTNKFQGHFDGGYHVISHLTNALFDTVSDAHIYNVVIDESQITNNSDYAGILCNIAEGATRIYNSGVRNRNALSQPEVPLSSITSSAAHAVGGLVGYLMGTSRVVNCYNFARVEGTNSSAHVAGIAGAVETFASRDNHNGVVFACANYGKIESPGETNKTLYPTIGGQSITAVQGNMNLYNYYWLNCYGKNDLEKKMNTDGTYGFESKYLNRFEMMRYILNTKRKHSGWWVNKEHFADSVKYGAGDSVIIGTWVLDTTIAPFPVVLPKYDEDGDLIVYRSIINPDYDSAWRDNAAPYQGRRLTEWWRADNDDNHKGMLKVTVKSTEHTVIDDTVWISITDMDTLAYDWNYGKIQLPYYQSVFHTPKISTDDYIVTGWKITSVKKGSAAAFTTGAFPTDTNLANRLDVAKDIYSSTNKRVFAQGGYYNVPYGVTEIVIEAYWGKAYYVCETNNDNYNSGKYAKPASVKNYGNSMYGNASKKPYDCANDKNNVKTTIADALTLMTKNTTVYDQAIVLLSDVHLYQSGSGGNAFSSEATMGFTITTIDEDYDNEPDHCLFHYFEGRYQFNSVRFDFIPYLDYSMTGVHNEAYKYLGIPLPKGHFEITETALARYNQFEYENTGNTSKNKAPMILNGGVFEQMVTVHNNNPAYRTTYFQLGGHVWFKIFAPGTHPDNTSQAKHCPVSVMGGQYDGFYLSSYLKAVSNNLTNNPVNCYISGGRIGEYASCGYEKVAGNATVEVDHLIVDNFFGGGINGDETSKMITDSISVTIDSSIVHGIFAAGPKYGSMNSGTAVTTSATGSTFGTYYGAGYGGTAISPTGTLLQGSARKGDLRHERVLHGRLTSKDVGYKKGKYTDKNSHKNEKGTVVDGAAAGVEIDYFFELMPFSTSDSQYVDRVYIRKANLSMAETYNVSSTLKGCTVKGNFYGGGFVGQVIGTATSTLTDCRVMGNVFAGGDNATVPTARVWDTVTNSDDYPIVSSGAFLQINKDKYAKYQDYTWTNKLSDFGVTAVAGLNSMYAQKVNDKYYIYTSQDLSKVGKCQATNLTVINTTVGTPGDTTTGSIYGGGNQAAMPVDITKNCTTNVSVEGNTRVYRDVFGAGKHGLVQGNTFVTIGKSGKSGSSVDDAGQTRYRPLVLGDVYGGGELADVEGNTNVTMYEGVTGPIYGGGNKGSIIYTKTTGNNPTYTPHNTTINILGGYVGYRPDYNDTAFAADAASAIYNHQDIIGDLLLTDANLKPDIKAVGRPKMYHGVFGGGYGYGTVVTGGSTVNIGADSMNADVKIYGSVYGGGEAGQVGGGFRTATFANADYMYDSASNSIVKKGNSEVAGTQYLSWDNPSNWISKDGWGNVAKVNVIPDGNKAKTIDIAGAVFGGGRGYFVTTMEEDGTISGTESAVTQPHAGAVYGNTQVTIGAANGDTNHLRIGSFNYFTDYEYGRSYNIVDTLSLTSQAVFWDQPLWVFDYHIQRYAKLTPGEASDMRTVAAKNYTGWTEWNLSAREFSNNVRYFLRTGRVSVAGGGERGAVYGQTAVKSWGLLSSDTARNNETRYFGNSDMLGGNTTVTVYSGTMGDIENHEVDGCVYGAGLSADIDGTARVTINGTGAWVRGDVYAGGCMGQVRAYGRAKDADILATQQTLTKGWVRNAHGGSNLTNHGKGCNSELIVGSNGGNNDELLVSESVYGGNGFSPSDGKATMIMNSGRIGYVRAGYDINNDSIGGGDHMESTKNNIVENNQEGLSYEGNVYGGGFGPEARVTRTEVTMNGGLLRNGVFGGGELAPVMEPCTTGTCSTYVYRAVNTTNGFTTDTIHYQPTAETVYRTTVTVNGGTMAMVLGGGRGYTDFLSTKNTCPGTVMGNTKVTLAGGTIQHTTIGTDLGGGNVYGGGLEGEVTGNTVVEVTPAEGKTLTVAGNVFGGGRGYRGAMEGDNVDKEENITARATCDAGAVYGNTSLTVNGGTVEGGVYGGGEGMNYTTSVLNYNAPDTVATVYGNATVAIHGGTLGGGYTHGAEDGRGSYAGGRVASVMGWADITVDGTANVAAVFGGNDISGKVMGGKNATPRTGTALDGTSLAGTETYVQVTGTPKIGRLFGGGNGKYEYYSDYAMDYLNIRKRPEQQSTYVDILLSGGTDTSAGYIGAAYGGGNQAMVGTAMAVLHNPEGSAGLVDSLYAGGNNATVSQAATVTVDCDTHTRWCNVNQLFGGNNQATMSILPTINLESGWFGRVFGGGNAGPMTGHEDRTDRFGKQVRNLSTYIKVESEDVVVRQALYGGCNHARVSGGTYVDVRKTSKKDSLTNARDYGIYQLFGGNDISDYVENSRIDVNGGVIHNIYGGGNGFYDYERNNDRWNAKDKTTQQIVATYVAKEPYVNVTRVNIWGGEIRSAIYGGGYAGNCGETHVVVNDTVGGASAAAAQSAAPKTAATGAIITGEIYGGGFGYEEQILTGVSASEHVGNVNGTAYVDLYHIDSLGGTKAYGGGKSGNVVNTFVTVHPGWEKKLDELYGGCWGGDVTGTARVVMNCKTLATTGHYNVRALYGGNDFSGNVYQSVLTVNSGRYHSIYGAGNGAYHPDSTLKYNKYIKGGDTITLNPPVPVPNSQFPVINFNSGIVEDNMYGGGNIGTCIVKDASESHTTLADYAFVQVNVHGGEVMNNIFAGAAGRDAASGTRPLIYGLKVLNMDSGLVHQSVYGGTESLSDGYWDGITGECQSRSVTSLRPSSVLNLVGGTVKSNVYGGGYLGNVYGSVYVNIGKDAVDSSFAYGRSYGNIGYASYKPLFTTDETADTGSTLMPRNLFLEHSVYNGANWGDADNGYIFNKQGFFGGEGRILIDGLGYNTSATTDGNSDPAMDIENSIIGAGTSCEGGDVHRHIHIRNYGYWEDCNASKDLASIQRCDSVMFEKVGLSLRGDQDAYTAYASTRYTMNRCDTVLFKGENTVILTQPAVNMHSLVFRDANGALVDDVTENATTHALTLAPGTKLTDMKNELGAASVCDDDCAKVDSVQGKGYSSLLVNNGSYIDVFYQDTTSSGADTIIYGDVKGYGFLRAEDQTQAIVTARYKLTAAEADTMNAREHTTTYDTVNPTDGGFFSLCPDDNMMPDSAGDPNHHGVKGGRFNASGDSIPEFNYGNYSTTYRAWKMGKGRRLRHITITAHSDLTELPQQNKRAATSYTIGGTTTNVNLAVARATLELPPTENGNYYRIMGGIKVDQENNEMNLINGALLPGEYVSSNDTTLRMWEDSIIMSGADSSIHLLNTVQWMTHDRSAVSSESIKKLVTDPSHNFGLLITGGIGTPLTGGTTGSNTAAIYSNTYFTGTNGYRTKAVNGNSNVMPTLDVYLTYNPEFTTTLLGDVEFTLYEYEPGSDNPVGSIDVIISISTVIKAMKNQVVDLVALYNEFDIHQYTRKLVLPASLVRRNLYLTSIKWEPTPSDNCNGCYGTEETFFLQDTNSPIKDTNTFMLRVRPTEDLSASLTTTLGWSDIGDTSTLDLFQTVKRVAGFNDSKRAYSAKDGDGVYKAVSMKKPIAGTEKDSTRGIYMGVLDGRAAAGLEATLFFNGDSTYHTSRKGRAVLNFEYYDQNVSNSSGATGTTASGSFKMILNVVTRKCGDTIYMASADTLRRDNITLQHWADSTHNGAHDFDSTLKGREPIQYLQTFTEVMSVYQAGDVICILDTVILTGEENYALHGTDYNFIPIVRYSGNHWQFPGKNRDYHGTMFSLREQSHLSMDHVIVDGSMVRKYKRTYTSETTGGTNPTMIPYRVNPKNSTGDTFSYPNIGWVMDTLQANGPIFEVRDGADLNLGHKTTVQNNWNAATSGMLGGAIRVASVDTVYYLHTPYLDSNQHTQTDTTGPFNSNPTLVVSNSVEIKNILTSATATGAIHMEDGTFQLGTAQKNTVISIQDNYTYDNVRFWDTVGGAKNKHLVVKTSVVDDWPKANVYLARTRFAAATDSAMRDSTSCIITFGNELSANSRIGISKVFPGAAFTIPAPSGAKTGDQHFAAVRDTIQVAQVTGTRQQYMLSAYKNGNFFNDGRLYGADHATVDTFYHPALSTSTLYLQRCATFQKQMFASVLPTTAYDSLPVLQYRMNAHATCPNGTDTMIFSVHGGCYPYTYTWTLDTGYRSSVIPVRTYTTPFQHDKVKADNEATNSEHLKAKASNSDSALLAYMLLKNDGAGDTFIYTVMAEDNFGCQLKQSFAVKMSRMDGTSQDALVLKNPIDEDDPDLKYAWGDTNVTGRNNVSTAIDTATRTYKAVHFRAIPLASSDWGTITCTRDGFDGTDTVASSDPLCPGDAIYLNATSTTHNFIQWDFDPYDIPQTVFVMPNSGTSITVYGYFGPKTYWKDVVKTQPRDFVTDYNGNVHISDANELAWLISLSNGLNGVQARTFFYDTVFLARGTYDMSEHLWTPLGTSQHPFMGVLMPEPSESGNVIIKGIIVNEPSMASVGFFGHLDSATVQDITLQKSHFVGQQYVGALAGESSTSKLTNITVQDESSLEQSADHLTTMITANYASGGLIGKSVKDTIKNNAVAARYMGATIYNGGMVGHATDVKASNTWTWSKPRMSSLYSGGAFGYSSGSTFVDTLEAKTNASAAKIRGGSQIVNCYVHYDNPDGKVTRAGGLVGRARNTYIANNYVYGENSAATLTGALGAVIENGVRVENCFFEQGFDNQAFGYNSYVDTSAVTTFSGSGTEVILTDTLGNNSNLARQLNRWVYAHGDTTLHYWHSDTANVNNGYPVFGEPEYQEYTATREVATCDGLLVAGQNYTTSGTYYYHAVDSAEFTDTTVTLYLTINYSELTEFTDSVRRGEGYEGHGFYLTPKEIGLMMQTLQEEGSVTVVVSDTLQTLAGCDSIVTLYLTVGSALTTPNSQLMTLKVYPNPTTKLVTVEADGLQQVELYDAVSRRLDVITSSRDNVITADLEAYPAGAYYLRIRTDNGTVIKKVIKR